MKYLCWSNDPDDLCLETYFDMSKPNVPDDYGVPGLKPVVRETGKDRFILPDVKERFYLPDAWDWELLGVPDKWMEGFESTEKIVENIIVYKSYKEEATAIWSRTTPDT
jgi:hypothetical protein